VALYYYSADSPTEEDRSAHGTIFIEQEKGKPT
jgi:hypothetical protein